MSAAGKFPGCVLLVRIDPARRMQRYYRIEISPSLIGGWLMVREWGRLGSRGRTRRRHFETRAEAEAAMVRLEREKRRRGYRTA